MEDERPPEVMPDDNPSGTNPQARGYFFYIATFFILIALLCYLIGNSRVNWSEVPAPLAPVSSSAAPP
jgi:hypothetical protein